MGLHVFVIMPFGIKEGINFDAVYKDYIKPALDHAEYEVFRADEELRAGEIRTDMFQELLLADLVIADLSIDNPNVWYELGVRHALRDRGIILIQIKREQPPFDVYTDRKLHYHIKDGVPDPAFIEEDKKALSAMAKETMAAWHGRKVSPVYKLLPNLQEPDWKSLRIGDVLEFWERHAAWEDRIKLARKAGRIGDVLVLANEAPVYAFRSEAWIKAGETLRKAERFVFALEHLERGLAINPGNLKGLREKGICLQRLACSGTPGYSLDLAREHYQNVLDIYPHDPETWALLGRVDKDAWIAAWRMPGKTPEQMREEAAYEDALLRAAVDSYAKGFRNNPGHYYSGINALTLMHLYQYLTNDKLYDHEMAAMAGAVHYAAECEADEDQRFWALTTLGDLEVLVGTPATVKVAYKEAIAKNDKSWFDLDSSLTQLQMLKDLGFRLENVEAGIATFDHALEKLSKPEDKWQPRHVILFSGHMIDAPGRVPPRFPPEKEPVAARAIAKKLDELGAAEGDLALCSGACGGDILFAEACLARGLRLEILIPFNEPMFLQESVNFAGDQWRERYFKVKANPNATLLIMPDELGPMPVNSNPYERINLWLLYSALSWGAEKVKFICLWNRQGGDGPGGTKHMHDEVVKRSGQVFVLDINILFKDDK